MLILSNAKVEIEGTCFFLQNYKLFQKYNFLIWFHAEQCGTEKGLYTCTMCFYRTIQVNDIQRRSYSCQLR